MLDGVYYTALYDRVYLMGFLRLCVPSGFVFVPIGIMLCEYYIMV